MIYDLQTTNRFKKNYKKMQKRGLKREDLEFVVDKLRNGARLEHKYKDHALSGDYKGCRECHIKPDWLLVYRKYEDKLILMLIDTGSHSDLFGL